MKRIIVLLPAKALCIVILFMFIEENLTAGGVQGGFPCEPILGNSLEFPNSF